MVAVLACGAGEGDVGVGARVFLGERADVRRADRLVDVLQREREFVESDGLARTQIETGAERARDLADVRARDALFVIATSLGPSEELAASQRFGRKIGEAMHGELVLVERLAVGLSIAAEAIFQARGRARFELGDGVRDLLHAISFIAARVSSKFLRPRRGAPTKQDTVP